IEVCVEGKNIYEILSKGGIPRSWIPTLIQKVFVEIFDKWFYELS
ncbi:unnamed protein product, partial [marine sediment metagenome]